MENINLKYYLPMRLLYELLVKLPCGCEFEFKECHDGYQIICDKDGEYEWDVVCHYGSYGGPSGKLETMGTIVDSERVGDDVEGYLEPVEVFAKFVKKYYEP